MNIIIMTMYYEYCYQQNDYTYIYNNAQSHNIHQCTGLTFIFGFGATDGLLEFSLGGVTLEAETAYLMLGPLFGAGGGMTVSEVDFCFCKMGGFVPNSRVSVSS